jgi:hypothetical protein
MKALTRREMKDGVEAEVQPSPGEVEAWVERAIQLHQRYSGRRDVQTSASEDGLPKGNPPVAPAQRDADGWMTATTKPKAVKTQADYDALPKGQSYLAPDGTTRVKGGTL